MQVRPFDPTDRESLQTLLQTTPEFSTHETAIALELADEVAQSGAKTTYRALSGLSDDGRLLGWACYGRTPMTASSFDLYWIVVANDARGLGVGRTLHDELVARVAADGGERLRIETSTREGYGKTLLFYDGLGYDRVGLITDFYAPGDDLVTSVLQVS